MTTLLMNTESITNLSARLRQTARLLMESSASLQQNATYMPWESNTRDQYVSEVHRAIQRLRSDAEKLNALADLTQREVNQWIETDAHLGGGASGRIGYNQPGGPVLYGGSTPNVPPMGSMHDLTDELWDKEGQDKPPIRIIKINENEYVVLLQGTEMTDLNPSNNWGSAFLSGMGVPADYERKVRNMILENVPTRAKIHLVGHSQGGIVANNITDNAQFASQYNIASVTTYGSPISSPPKDHVLYKRYLAGDDPVPLANVGTYWNAVFFGLPSAIAMGAQGQKLIDSNTINPFAAHGSYPNSQMLKQEGLPFTATTWDEVACGKSEAEYGASKALKDLFSPGDIGQKGIALFDTVTEAGSGFIVGSGNKVVDGLRGVLPTDLGQKLDLYRDHLMENYAVSPTTSQMVSAGYNSASNAVQSTVQQTSQWASETAQRAFSSVNNLVVTPVF